MLPDSIHTTSSHAHLFVFINAAFFFSIHQKIRNWSIKGKITFHQETKSVIRIYMVDNAILHNDSNLWFLIFLYTILYLYLCYIECYIVCYVVCMLCVRYIVRYVVCMFYVCYTTLMFILYSIYITYYTMKNSITFNLFTSLQ